VFCILAFLARSPSGPTGGHAVRAGGGGDEPNRGGESVEVVEDSNLAAAPTRPATDTAPAPVPVPVPVPAPPPAPVPSTGAADTRPAATPQEAQRLLDSGKAHLAAGKLLEARSELSRAIFCGLLSQAEESQAVRAATEAADKTVLGLQLIEGDPYQVPYMVAPKQFLEGPGGIEMAQQLHVPARLLERVNGLASGAGLQAGKTIKLIKGPFHAIVRKSRFVMDVYLEREGLERVFIRRIAVGLGMNSSTPVGAWQVKKGDKMWRPHYNATGGSGLPVGTRILYGQPGYPFGVKALWIGLEGTDVQTKTITDFGIHSTNDPTSIGKANSLGCVRMADADIELVFSLLYDVHSRVDVLP
jgi:lipoprotein-anchoring transpeptidase ErfK/SrfK